MEQAQRSSFKSKIWTVTKSYLNSHHFFMASSIATATTFFNRELYQKKNLDENKLIVDET